MNITCDPAGLDASGIKACNSIAGILQARAAKTPDTISYTFLTPSDFTPVALTYAEVDQKARMVAAYLQSIKAEGERALLVFEPGLGAIIGMYGCLYAKVLAVPLYPPLNEAMTDNLVHIIQDTQAKVIFTTSTLLAKLTAVNQPAHSSKADNKSAPQHDSAPTSILSAIPNIKKLQIVCIDSLPEKLAAEYKPQSYDLEQIAYLQYTSGSTAVPKGVMVTNKNLLTNLTEMEKHYRLTKQDVMVSWLPPYHDLGLVGAIFAPIFVGFHAIHMSPYDFIKDPYCWLLNMSKYKATIGSAPDFGYRLCIKKIKETAKHSLDLKNWRIASCGSEVVHADTLIHFYHAFKDCGLNDAIFFPSYGLAEATLFVSGENTKLTDIYHYFNRDSLQKSKAVSVAAEHHAAKKLVSHGKPPANLVLQIVDSERGVALADSEIGEIWVSGDSIVPGYWLKAIESAESMQAKLAQFPGRKFLRTGDLGFIHDGKLYIVGRCKDLIIINGKNHYPQDLETDIETHFSSLRPGCIAVFSVEEHHQEHAIIVAEYKSDGKVMSPENYQALINEVKHLMANNHQLHVKELVLIEPQTLPKTTSGKIQRSRCKNLYSHHQLKIIYRG